MTDVEQKVVQMRFDDKEFDEKARKTMKTLDKLADKLSFDEVAKRSDAAFKEVTENVEKIADQAYTIIDRVIDKIRNDIADKLVGYIKSATIDQVANGWQKYSDMTTAVGTLLSQGHKIEKVNKTLEDLSYFADETSYSFNDMLSGISKFTASGVKLEDAKVALMGISNWAAQSGQNAETASHVFGQLAQAMGSYMKKQDWQSVQTANMDTREFRQTALDTAVAMGTLKKVSENTYVSLRATTKAGAQAFTIDDFANSLTQGAWMTSEVMTETYKKYAVAVERIKEIYDNTDEKTGTIIKQRQAINKDLIKRYSEIYNVTEETAKKELDKWSSVKKATDEEVKNYATLNKISEELADKKINANYYNAVEEYSKRTRKSMLETEKDLEQWSEYVSEFSLKAFLNAQEARTFTDVISSVKESAASAWREIYTAIFGDYNEAKVLWTDLSEGLIGIFTDRLHSIADIFSAWKEAGGRTTMLQGMYAFGGGIKMFIDEIRAAWDDLITDGESGVNVLLRISEKIREAGFRFYLFMEALRDNGVFKNIAEALHNIKVFIDQVFGALYDGVRDAIPGGNFFLTLLIDFTTLLKDLTANFKLSDTALEGLRKTFKGVFIILNHSKKTIMDLLIKVVLPILNVVFSVLGNIMDVVLTLTGTIGDIIEYFMPLDGETSGWIKALSALADILGEVIKLIGNGLSWALQKIIPIIGVTLGSVVSLGKAIGDLFNAKKIKMGSGSGLMKGFSGLKDKILEAWAPLKSFSEIIDQYKNGKGLVNFLNLFTDITDGIGNRLLLTMDATVGFIETLGESKFGKALKGAIAVLRWVIRAGLWLFNNLLVPALKEIVMELGLTIESVKGIIDERGILGLLDLIQEVFKTGIFGSLVNTINLINSVIGSNGVGKLFSKGAKALESITSYFNAAKMNQAADVMLKIVAAMGLLYALLALITFFPVENYERMKQALVDFGIALGVVVGGVFVISAAAALAGENLVALAGAFVGIAVAIGTAFWALKKMSNLINEINEEQIDKAMDKLEAILNKYSWIIIKVIAPFALLSTRYSGSIAGIGAVFVGLAASIYVLIKSMQEIDSIQVDDINKIAEFIKGIYLVFAASTALMVFASAGKDVHGISIAIASIGVAFAAIKMILPLCKDIIAEKDVFMDAQSALATFGLFMLAMSASMYFVVSGVHGILSGIVAMLLFKAFLSMLENQIIPLTQKVVDMMANLARVFDGGTGTYFGDGSFNPKSKLPIILAIGTVLLTIIGIAFAFREIVGWWGEVDPMAILWIAVTIVGGMAVFAEVLLPSITKFMGTVSRLAAINPAGLMYSVSILGLLIAPIFALAAMFVIVMWKFQNLYDKLGMARIGINVGIFTRQYNAVASMFQSIMLTILFMYTGIAGIIALAAYAKIDPAQFEAVKSVLWNSFINILAIVGGLSAMWIIVMKYIREMAQFSSNLDISQATEMVKAISGAISGIIAGVFFTTLAALIAALVQNWAFFEKTDNFIKILWHITGSVAAIMLGVGLLIVGFAFALKRLANAINTAGLTGNSLAAQQIASMAKVMAVMMTTIMAITGIIVLVSSVMAIIGSDLDRYGKTLLYTGLAIAGIMAALAGFIFIVSFAMKKNSYMSMNAVTGDVLRPYTYMIEMIAAMAGLVGTLIAIGAFIIPGIKKLETMDLSKLIVSFLGMLTLILAPAAAIRLMTTVSTVTTGAASAASWMAWAKALGTIVIPLGAITTSVYFITEQLSKLAGISDTTIAEFNKMILIIGGIAALISIISMVGGAIPAINAGIAGVALALGGMVALIGLGIYLAGQGIALIRGFDELVSTGESIDASRLTRNMNRASADAMQGMANGVLDNEDVVLDAYSQVGEDAKDATKQSLKERSPSKEFEKIGKFCDQGLANGINRNTRDVIRASRGLADITESVFEDDLEIASPSKVFYKNGRFIVAGLQEGITSQKTSLADTMSGLGETLSKSIEDGFSGLDIDIFGGKTMKDFIHEFTGGEDAGSIIGKMLGLDDEYGNNKKFTDEYLAMAKQVGDVELERLAYIESRGGKTPDWFANRFADKSLGDKIGDKISKMLGSNTVKNLVSDAAKSLGIEVTDSMTSEEVLDHLGEKILGKEGDRTVVGEIVDKISSGNWVGVGESIGSGIITGLGAILKEKIPSVTRLLKRINPFADKEVGTYFDVRNLEGGLSVWESDSDEFANFEGKVGKAMFKFDKSFNDYTADQVMNAINVDYANRMKEFAAALDNAKVWDEYTKTWIYHIDESCEAAIKELFEKWGIASPSKVSTYAYQMVGEGGVNGIKEYTPKLVKAMQDQTSEEYKTMSLGVQALDELASGETVVQPRLVPIIDTASMAAFTGITDAVSGVNGAKISASLDYTGSMSFLAAGQAAIVSAVDAMKRDLLNSLSLGELIKVDVNSTVNDDNLFDHFVTIDRQEYNRTGRHAW